MNEVRIVKTKIKPNGAGGGEDMAFIDCINRGVSVSITMFPKDFARYKRLVVKGEVGVFTCKVNEYKGNKTLLAEEVMTWH